MLAFKIIKWDKSTKIYSDCRTLFHFESQSSVVRILKYVILRPSTTELCLKLILEDAYEGTIPIND